MQVILSTNIAETSVTVPGVRYVVDTGFVKARAYSGKAAAECLQVVPVSQAQARQRAGRAGHSLPPVSLNCLCLTQLPLSHSTAPVSLNCPCLTQLPLSHSTAPFPLDCPCLIQLLAFAKLLACPSHAHHVCTCMCMRMSAQPPIVTVSIDQSMSDVIDRFRQAGQVRRLLADYSAYSWMCHCSWYTKHCDKHI